MHPSVIQRDVMTRTGHPCRQLFDDDFHAAFPGGYALMADHGDSHFGDRMRAGFLFLRERTIFHRHAHLPQYVRVYPAPGVETGGRRARPKRRAGVRTSGLSRGFPVISVSGSRRNRHTNYNISFIKRPPQANLGVTRIRSCVTITCQWIERKKDYIKYTLISVLAWPVLAKTGWKRLKPFHPRKFPNVLFLHKIVRWPFGAGERHPFARGRRARRRRASVANGAPRPPKPLVRGPRRKA